jgi:hypothetical protein
MKHLLFTTFIICISLFCNAQQKKPDTSKVVFKPPVLVKDEPVKTNKNKAVTPAPPAAVKHKPSSNKKAPKVEVIKFKPPVLVKDTVQKQ